MPRMQDVMPQWIVALTESPLGVTGTIVALTGLASSGDTADARTTYASYAARLSAWATIPGEPSTAVLPDAVPLPE